MPIGQAKFGLLGGIADLGRLELIQTQEHSGDVTEVDFTDIKEDIYHTHLMTLQNMDRGDGLLTDYRPTIQLFESGVIEDGAVYSWALRSFTTTSLGTSSDAGATSAEYITGFTDADDTSVGDGVSNGIVWFYDLGNSSKPSSCSTIQASGAVTGVYTQVRYGGGALPQLSVVDGIRVRWELATLEFGSYEISLYGLKAE